jgi:hypothetical protein
MLQTFAHLILLDLTTIIMFYEYYESWILRNAIFSSLVILASYWSQIFSSALCSHTPWIYVLPIIIEWQNTVGWHLNTKYETHREWCKCTMERSAVLHVSYPKSVKREL